MAENEFDIPDKKENAEKRIEELREEIRYHDKKYYIEDNPEISDYEYDQLMNELEALEQAYPDLISSDSPTQRVGSEKIEEFETVEHLSEMLSLDKAYNTTELEKFDKDVREKTDLDKVDYIIEPKIDGLGVALYYKERSFKRGATRGDGVKGEDITPNLKTIKSIPLKLSEDSRLKTIEARGEVYMPRDKFDQMNRTRVENGKEPFANPRNAASGTVRTKDPQKVATRPLEIFIYALTYNEEGDFNTHLEALEEVKRAGLRINEIITKVKGIDKVIDIINEWEKKKVDLNYEIDGVVVKVNDLHAHDVLGSTTHHPRWAIAYKYPPTRKTTKIKEIEVTVGRTGKLTPVAVLDPIHLAGTEVSRASLHNEDELQKKDVRIGDTALVEKAGEIIPQIVKVIKEKRDGSEKKFEMPHTCPICGSKAIQFGDEVARKCINAQCPAQVKQRIEHWGDRNAMDIDGLGPKLLDKLVDQEIISNIGDLYTLKLEDLISIERMGKKSSNNLLNQIEASKKQGLKRALYGLGIDFVGKHIAHVLTDHYKNIDDLMAASKTALENIDEIGPKIAESVVTFFNEEKNKTLINRLLDHGVVMKSEKGEYQEFLEGKKFVFTGALNKYTRDEASEKVRNFGGRVTSSVSGETDYVVVGENPGSKLEEAKKENTIRLDEDEFLSMLENQKLPT